MFSNRSLGDAAYMSHSLISGLLAMEIFFSPLPFFLMYSPEQALSSGEQKKYYYWGPQTFNIRYISLRMLPMLHVYSVRKLK